MACKRPPPEIKGLSTKNLKEESIDDTDWHKSHNLLSISILAATVGPTDAWTSTNSGDIRQEMEFVISSHLSQGADFALSDRFCSEFSSKIDLQGYGVLPLPVNEEIYYNIHTFITSGLNEISLDQNLSNFDSNLDKALDKTILQGLGICKTSQYQKVFSKIVISGPGCELTSKDLKTKLKDVFTTILVQLPSIFTGGESIVSHDGMPRIFTTSKDSSDNSSYIAFYSACEYAQKKIITGYRTFLHYDLVWRGTGPIPSPNFAAFNIARLANLLNSYMDCPNKDYLLLPYTDDFQRACSSSVIGLFRNALNLDEVNRNVFCWELFSAEVLETKRDLANVLDLLWHGTNLTYDIHNFQPLSDKSCGSIKHSLRGIKPDEITIHIDLFHQTESWQEMESFKYSEMTKEYLATRRCTLIWRLDTFLNFKLDVCAIGNPSKLGFVPLKDRLKYISTEVEEGSSDRASWGLQRFMFSKIRSLDRYEYYSSILELLSNLKLKDRSVKLMNMVAENKSGFINEDFGIAISKLSTSFPEDNEIRECIKQVLAQTQPQYIDIILGVCKGIDWLSDEGIVDILKASVIRGNGIDKPLWPSDIHVVKLVEFMFSVDKFPMHENFDEVICSIKTWHTIEMILLLFIANKYFRSASRALDKLISLAKSVPRMQWDVMGLEKVLVWDEADRSFLDICSCVRAVLPNPKPDVEQNHANIVRRFGCSVLLLPDVKHQQFLLRALVTESLEKYGSDLSGLPPVMFEPMIRFFKVRRVYLEQEAPHVLRKPVFSWCQPAASIPKHPEVEAFLRGPQEKLIYENFTGINKARNFCDSFKYTKDTCMKMVPSGKGKDTVVEVVKMKNNFERLVCEFEEFKALSSDFIVPQFNKLT